MVKLVFPISMAVDVLPESKGNVGNGQHAQMTKPCTIVIITIIRLMHILVELFFPNPTMSILQHKHEKHQRGCMRRILLDSLEYIQRVIIPDHLLQVISLNLSFPATIFDKDQVPMLVE
jgi:hypothetical protein